MAEFKYGKNESLIWDCNNCIVFENGEVKNPNDLDGVEITKVNNYCLNNIYNKEYTEQEKEILKKSQFVTYVNINKSSDIKLIFESDKDYSSNVVININDNIDANITKVSLNNKNENNLLLEVICNNNSNVKFKTIEANENNTNNKVNFYVLESVNIEVDTLSLNDKNVGNCTNIYLLKQFSHLTLNNAIINNTSLVQAYDFNVYHLNKDSESTLTNYAICKDSSTLKINSNGIIKQGCSKSKIMQKSKGIILDLTSAISANPLLQIDEFDVEANHGASIGAIDDEDLYYLMSRGLTKSQSEQLIVSGYMQPIISKMNEEQLQKYASFLIENKLN